MKLTLIEQLIIGTTIMVGFAVGFTLDSYYSLIAMITTSVLLSELLAGYRK